MKGYELEAAIGREMKKQGKGSSPVKVLTDEGDIFDIEDAEIEEQADGTSIIWIKASFGG